MKLKDVGAVIAMRKVAQLTFRPFSDDDQNQFRGLENPSLIARSDGLVWIVDVDALIVFEDPIDPESTAESLHFEMRKVEY